MKKIVFISGIQIFPPESGGQIRSANFCRALKKLDLQIEIYSFTGRKKDYFNFKKNDEIKIEENISEFTNRNPALGFIQFLFYQFKLPPIWLTLMTKLYLPKTLRNKLNKCDMILLDFPYLYPIAAYSKKPIRLNTHNAEYQLHKKNPVVVKLVKKIELKCFKAVEHIFFCSVLDQQVYINAYPDINKKSSILPNGVDLAQYKSETQSSYEVRRLIRQNLNISTEKNILLFTGSQYHPNIEAYEFLRQWSIKNKDHLIELNILILVVGTVCQNLINEPHFKVIGRVDNIIPFFWASDYGINPVTEGSGTNVKMIEFLASGLPIITTVFGTRGLNFSNIKSCFYFERDQLYKTLKSAVSQDFRARQIMARNALEENIQYVDMENAIKSLSITW